jgi:hypothetical protein
VEVAEERAEGIKKEGGIMANIGDVLYYDRGVLYLTPAGAEVKEVKAYKQKNAHWARGLAYLFFMYSRHSPFINKPLVDRRALIASHTEWSDKDSGDRKAIEGKEWEALVKFYEDLHVGYKEKQRMLFLDKARKLTEQMMNSADPKDVIELQKAIDALEKQAQKYERDAEDENMEDASRGMLYLFELPEDQKPTHLKLPITREKI